MKNLEYRDYYRRNLPHLQPRGATFLVNFRLAGSLPEEVVERLRAAALGSETADFSLARIMHNIKRNSAKQANNKLGRTGAFWQHENYDHFARDEKELERIIKYVLHNPVKAGQAKEQADWKWSYCKYDI